MPTCGQGQSETQGRATTLQQRGLRYRHTACHAKVLKRALKMETLWKYSLSFVKDVPVIHAGLITIVVTVLGRNLEPLLSNWPSCMVGLHSKNVESLGVLCFRVPLMELFGNTSN